MAKIDRTYHELVNTIIKEGFTYEDPNRKNVQRIQIPEYTIKHDFKNGFPALTTKKVYFKGAVGELIAFLNGAENLRDLENQGVKFWRKDAYNFYKKLCLEENLPVVNFDQWFSAVIKKEFWEDSCPECHSLGSLGRIYPYQMRKWSGYYTFPDYDEVEYSGDTDQIQNLIDTLKTNPMATKKTVTMWNPAELHLGALSPCHWSFEILVEPINLEERRLLTRWSYMVPPSKKELDGDGTPKYQFTLKWHQHSVDTFLGLPINIMYYSLMAYIIGKMTNMIPKSITGDLSNVHIYDNHIKAIKQQLNNDPFKYNSPSLDFDIPLNFYRETGNIDDVIKKLNINQFKLKNYESYPLIKAEMLAYNK